MKKNISLFLAALVGILVCFTLAAAYRTGGEFAGDSVGGGNPLRFTPNFAPKSGVSTTIANNGVYNLNVKDKTAVKFTFLKVSDSTAAITGRMKYATVTRGTNTGLIPVQSETFTVGKGVQTLGFANASTAGLGTPVYLNVHWQ